MNVDDVTHRFLEVYRYLIEEKLVRSAAQFANEISLSRSGFNEVEKGRSKIGMQPVLNLVLSFSFINKYWLLFGEGEMLKEASPNRLFDNEEQVRSRMKDFLCSLPSPTNELTNSIKLSISDVQEVISGSIPLTTQFIIDFLDIFPKLRIKWLINGDGNMVLNRDNTDDERIQELKYTIEIQKKLLNEYELKLNKRNIKAVSEQPHHPKV